MPEILDPLTGLPRSTFEFRAVTEIMDGRRAFPQTQAIFAGAPTGPTVTIEVGWYDSSTHPETGAFALVNTAAGLDDLIGEVVRVTRADRAVFVYVIESADLDTPLSLARRAFAQIGRLSLETSVCDVVRTLR